MGLTKVVPIIFRGKVLDKVSLKPVEAEIKIIDNSSENNYNTLKTNRLDGSFLVALPSGKNYGISIESKNYLFHSENFDLPIDSGFNIVEKEIYLKNISVGNNIILNNVFFDLDKYNLKMPGGWYGSLLRNRSVEEEWSAMQDHLSLLKLVNADVFVFADVSGSIQGDQNATGVN